MQGSLAGSWHPQIIDVRSVVPCKSLLLDCERSAFRMTSLALDAIVLLSLSCSLGSPRVDLGLYASLTAFQIGLSWAAARVPFVPLLDVTT